MQTISCGPRRLAGLAAALGVATSLLLVTGCQRRDATETGNAVERGGSAGNLPADSGTGTGTGATPGNTGTGGTTPPPDTGAVAPPVNGPSPPVPMDPASMPAPAASQ